MRWRRVDDSRGWVFDILSELCVQFVIGVSHLASEVERDGVVSELGVGMGKVVGAELGVQLLGTLWLRIVTIYGNNVDEALQLTEFVFVGAVVGFSKSAE